MNDIDKIYHVCRFCHWFDGDGYCNHEDTFSGTTREDYVDSIYLITEKGHVHDAVKEIVDVDKITEIIKKQLENTRLSKKAREEIMKTLAEEINEELLIDWIPDITDAVQDVYIKHVDDETTLCSQPEIVSPETFYCRYYQ